MLITFPQVMAESTDTPATDDLPSPGDTGGEEEETPGYKVPKQVDLKTLQQLDADDESLVKYKEQLLGKTTNVLGKICALIMVHCVKGVFV